MVRMADLLDEALVVDDLRSRDREGLFSEFSAVLFAAGRVSDGGLAARALADREALGGTGIGDGVAIPHGKMRGLRETVLAFGRSAQGIDFRSPDGRPAHLIFVMIAPEENPGAHLKLLARISRMLRNPEFRRNLRAAPHRAEIRRMIIEEDRKYCQP